MIYVATAKAIVGKSGLILMARILGAQKTPITQASLSAIGFTVTDLTSGAAIVTNQAITISSAIFDNLQLDGVWDADSLLNPSLEDGLYGYNFRFTVPAADMVPSGDRFLIEVEFTPVSGEPFTQQYSIQTVKSYRPGA